jgi:chromosome partitioning protein
METPTTLARGFEPLDEVISVLHTKGGAGKSSLTTNVAFELARLGYRILVIDLDRQTGQSVGFGLGSVTFTDRQPGSDIGAVLRRELPLGDAIIENIYPGLDLLPADETSLIRAEHQLTELGPEGTVRLFEILHESEKRWDVVFIDTPGRKTDILEVALAASTGVLVPAIPEGGPVSELSSVLRHVAKAKDLYGSVEVYGIVRMRVGGNSRYRRLAEEQTKEVASAFGAPVFKNKVPEDAKFGEAHLAREPIGAYAESARSAIAYKFIAAELVTLRGWPSPHADKLANPQYDHALAAPKFTNPTPQPSGVETNLGALDPGGLNPGALNPGALKPGPNPQTKSIELIGSELPDHPGEAPRIQAPAIPTSNQAPHPTPHQTPRSAPVVEPAFVSVPPIPVTDPLLAALEPGHRDSAPSSAELRPSGPRRPARPAPKHARKSAA